ncbi:MAG: Mov34/MPN/PAD-1 family protein [Acidobacteriota bacterium]
MNEYQYVLELFREDSTPVGRAEILVDWEPAGEWAKFAALRQGILADGETARVLSIDPIWHSKVGEPLLDGFRVNLAINGSSVAATDFTTDYFRSLALQASSAFVEKGKLAKGENINYVAAAFPRVRDESAEMNSPELQLTVEEVATVLNITHSSIALFMENSDLMGEAHEEDPPVFIPREVFDEARAFTRQAGAKETGGILIGHLRRDPEAGEVFLEVTAQIPARDAESDLTSLKFTPAVWTEVRAAIELRRRGEIMLGWWHSHPVREWCRECPVERQRKCAMASEFFSAHDRHLQRTVFPGAYSIALVANDTMDDITFSAFGWRRGVVEPRGVYVVR